jgi:hypothetical protein
MTYTCLQASHVPKLPSIDSSLRRSGGSPVAGRSQKLGHEGAQQSPQQQHHQQHQQASAKRAKSAHVDEEAAAAAAAAACYATEEQSCSHGGAPSQQQIQQMPHLTSCLVLPVALASSCMRLCLTSRCSGITRHQFSPGVCPPLLLCCCRSKHQQP